MNDITPALPPLADDLGLPTDFDAVKLAMRMARAAGRQKPTTMARACYMLLCTATMAGDPETYFEWHKQMTERGHG